MDRLRVLRPDSLLASVKISGMVAFVDGAARGNPGPAAAGVVIQDTEGKTLKTLSVAYQIEYSMSQQKDL